MNEQNDNFFFEHNYPAHFTTSDKMRIFFITNFPHNNQENTKNLPTLIFNYGLVCSNAHWQHQIAFFSKQGYDIIVHDYRGHYSSGTISNMAKDATFIKIVNDIYELHSHLKRTRIVMFGHSMGVNISLQFALTHPEMLEKLVLISGSIISPDEIMMDSHIVTYLRPTLKFISDCFPGATEELWSNAFMNPLIKKGVHLGGFNTKKVSTQFVELYLKRIGQLSPQLFFQLFQEMHDHKIATELSSITPPSLIIAGDQDKVIPLHVQTLLQKKLPKAELYLVRNGSHVPQADFPETINEKILRFLTVPS